MVTEKNYLVQKLKEAGIKSQVYTTMKGLKASNESHVGAVLRNGESFMRSGSKKTYRDEEGRQKCRVKLFSKNTEFNVVIGDVSEEKCEEILENFLRIVGKGIEVDRNWENIVIGDTEWLGENDSILRAKMAVQFIVTFEGGIYEDKDMKAMKIGAIKKEE